MFDLDFGMRVFLLAVTVSVCVFGAVARKGS
jgi:hypothetical protein